MSRMPMPKVSLLVVAMGGALLLGQQVAGVDLATGAPGSAAPDAAAVVLTVPAANVTPAGSFVADLHVDDAAAPTLR